MHGGVFIMDINAYIFESIDTKLRILKDPNIKHGIIKAAHVLRDALSHGKTLLAADAQHFVAELSGGNFLGLRKNFPAIALTTNTSSLTAIGNDFGYDQIFSRQLEALGKPGDMFCGISTSGNSHNIVEAFHSAWQLGMTTIGLLGNGGGEALPLCTYPFVVPSQNTQHIQEAHIMIIHMLCMYLYEEQ